MAATILTVGSKFNPLSFDEMAKPLMMYKQEADKIETAINDYTEKGDVIGSLINPQQDVQASNIYNKFRNEAQSATDSFYNNGLNPDIRKQLLNLKRSYADNMTKIQAAYTAREKERTMQNELKAKDPTMMFSRDANYESLDSYLMGEQPTYKSVSGDYLYKLGLQAGKSASTRQDLTVEAKKALENTYWELKQKQGFTDSQALEYMSTTNPMFQSIVSNIRNGSNIDSLNPNDQERANSAILNGILSGLVGEQKVDYKPVINVNVNTKKDEEDSKPNMDLSKFYRVDRGTDTNENVKALSKDLEFVNSLYVSPDGSISNPNITSQLDKNQKTLEKMEELKRKLGGEPTIKNPSTKEIIGGGKKKYYIGDKEVTDYKKQVLIDLYFELGNKIDNINKDINHISELKDKYSGLSREGDLDSIQKGTQIAYNQNITDNSIIGFDTIDNSKRNNILSNLNDRFKKMTIFPNSDDITKATSGLFIDEGNGFKPVDSELFNKYLAGSDGTPDISKFSLGASFETLKYGNGLVLTTPISDGKEMRNLVLTWKGDDFSSNSSLLKKSDDFVKTYDGNFKVDATIEGVSGVELAETLKTYPTIDIGEGINLGSGLKGHIIRTGDGDIVKVVTRGYGNNREIIQISTMMDEYEGGSTDSTFRSSTLTTSLLNLLGYAKGTINK